MICIAEFESSFRPNAVNSKLNKDGSADYGLYQINAKYWFKACKLDKQKALIPIYNIRCAKLVYDKQGYNAWVAYKKHKKTCDNRPVIRYKLKPETEVN